MSQKSIDLAIDLCSKASVTPKDEGCQEVISQRLQKHGFSCQQVNYENVCNLWATHSLNQTSKNGSELSYDEPVFLFIGHIDVVPTGDLTQWESDPFEPTIRNNNLYARGVADMKGSVSTFCVAVEEFVQQNPNHKGTIVLLITSDEEGPAINGIQRVCKEFIPDNNIKIDYCLVGEPTSDKIFGDTVKNGRRGSLSATLIFKGKQGHVAYADKANNPIHFSLEILQQIKDLEWESNSDFPPTTMQISNIHGGIGVDNVIPETVEVHFNFRYGTANSVEQIQTAVENLISTFDVDYQIKWHSSALPFITNKNSYFVNQVVQSVTEVTKSTPELSTAGGTSDGRFIKPLGAEVVEFGPMNSTIHQINECLAIDEFSKLHQCFSAILNNVLK